MGYLTSQELQDYLKISKSTLQRLRDAGLPYEKLGHRTIRYDLEKVENWLSERTESPR